MPNIDLTNTKETRYREIKCPRCGRILAVGRITLGHLEIKCSRPRCKAMVKISQYGTWAA